TMDESSRKRGPFDRVGAYLRRIVSRGVGCLNWPCVPGRRPRPDDIDASHSARDEGLRQTEFDSQGPFFSVRNDFWFHCSKLPIARVGSSLVSEGSEDFGSTDRD